MDGRIGVQPGYSVGAFLRSCHVPLDEGSQQADELAQKLLVTSAKANLPAYLSRHEFEEAHQLPGRHAGAAPGAA